MGAGTRFLPDSPTTNLTVRHRLGSATVEIHSPVGLLAAHRLARAGADTIVRSDEHHPALKAVALAAFSAERLCVRKANRSPGPEALAAAGILGAEGRSVVVDLVAYAPLAEVGA